MSEEMHVVTLFQSEKKMFDLVGEVADARTACNDAEFAYARSRAALEIGLAEARMRIGARHADMGVRVTVQEREDQALVECKALVIAQYDAEAMVKAMRGNVQMKQTQADLVRSISSSVRTSVVIQ